MKHRICLFTLFAIFSYCGIAQTIGKSLYIYRNDGYTIAFNCSEVDSITFSMVDMDGVVHNEFVTQEIWRPNGLYRISIQSIDSISFEPDEERNDSIRRWNDRLSSCEYVAQCLYGNFVALSEDNPLYNSLKDESYDNWLKLDYYGKIVSVSLENGYDDEAYRNYLLYLPYERRTKELSIIYYPGLWEMLGLP